MADKLGEQRLTASKTVRKKKKDRRGTPPLLPHPHQIPMVIVHSEECFPQMLPLVTLETSLNKIGESLKNI